jgi:NADH-quinone oxidoreductase subunit N
VTSLQHDLVVMAPELIMAGAGLLLLVVGVLQKNDRSMGVLSVLAILAMAGAAYFVVTLPASDESAFGGAFVNDGFARFSKILILLGSALTIVMSHGYFVREKIARFEFPVLVIFATVGMLLMVSASRFLALYMGLELQSLSLYVLAAFNRDSVRSSEAGLKYFVLGALSSGMMLYGISLIYGFTGTTDFAHVAAVVKQTGAPIQIGLIIGIVFLISGLAFKVAAVPFHMWTPDVYEGSPTPITAFFAMSPKIAAMALFLRAVIVPFPDAIHQWQQIIVVASVLSMILGSVAAIGQTNIKRLMAYSSIGHMGYTLLGLAAGSRAGVEGVLIYLTIYLVTNAGVFTVILAMKRGGQMVETISDLSGLARTQPRMAFAFAVFMLSLAGIPPLAGFFAKFYVFLAAIQAHLYGPAIIGVLASVIGAYYYLRIVKIMYFDEPAPAFDRDMGVSLGTILAVSSLFTLLFIVGAAPIWTMAAYGARALVP